jgi:hypothetical protein
MFPNQGKRFVAFGVIAGCLYSAYDHGLHFETYPGPSPKTLFNIAAATSTSSLSAASITMNLTSFAKIEPSPIVPAKDKQQQT